MKLLHLVQLLLVVTTALAGVIGADKRNAISSAPCGDLAASTVTVGLIETETETETTTETQFTTIIAQPSIVTVALQDPAAISSSLRSAFSVESQQLEISSQWAPINPFTSGHPNTATSATRFTRTIIVPVVAASKTSAASGQTTAADVYYIGESNGTTTWLTDFIPHESMTIGTTTVTLSPVPSGSASHTVRSRTTERGTHTNTVTTTVNRSISLSSGDGGSFTSVGYQGWNSSTLDSAAPTLSRCSTNGGGDSNSSSSFQVVTVRRTSTIATTTVYLSASTASMALPTGAYGSPVNIIFPTADFDHRKRSGEGGHRRAVCEWVTATMRGTPVSWPNNWDGSKTVDCATFTSSTPQSEATQPVTLAITTITVKGSTSLGSTPPTETIISVSTTSTSAAPASTTSCGVSGDFTLDFDTLPQFFPPDNDTAPFPPIFNPYRKLFFSSGWAYVPPPTTPVLPQNGSHLAIYVPTAPETNSSVSQSSNAGDVPSGSFGAGPRAYDNAYWFDADTLYIFCDNGATDPTMTCDVVVIGYQWDNATQSETVVRTQHFIQPPCPGYRDCQTSQIFLDAEFRALSRLSLYAVVNGRQKNFFMDTVELTWSDNSCEAGLHRGSQI